MKPARPKAASRKVGGITKSGTNTLTNVASSVTSVQILAANGRRLGSAIFNDSTAVLYLKLGAGAASTTSFTLPVAAGAYYEVPFVYTGVINGVWAAANGFARVTEFK